MDKTCTRCGLHKFRCRIVPGRGTQPADILFIGEAPGKSEDIRGEAFVGPSGRILNSAIEKATKIAGLADAPPTVYITNVVRCRPTDEQGGKNRQPTIKEAWACREWLEEAYTLTQPRLVVLLGKVAETFAKQYYPAALCLYHPAYIIRKGGIGCPEYRVLVRNLANTLRDTFGEEE